MITKCIDNDFPCQDVAYCEFDNIACQELEQPMSASGIVNYSLFCTQLPVDPDLIIGDLNHKLFLKNIRNKSGLYHLWIDHDECDDHGTYTMLCVYVGKGFAEGRIIDHIKEKWPHGVELYATFTQMENRLAKYYEQLFMDVYNFHLNTIENPGEKPLYAVWDAQLHNIGTHLNETSNISKVRSFDDI